jgi:hypothetical protein
MVTGHQEVTRTGMNPADDAAAHIVWWVNEELLEHAAEIWYVRHLYAASH